MMNTPSKQSKNSTPEAPPTKDEQKGGLWAIIDIFSHHGVAANLLMSIIILCGIVVLSTINVQFFPDFSHEIIQVNATWSGATAKDMDENIVQVIEPSLRYLEGVQEVYAESKRGTATIYAEYKNGTDMSRALSEVESQIARLSSYPQAAEKPKAKVMMRYENIFKIILGGPFPEQSLQNITVQTRNNLLGGGIDRIDISGYRNHNITVAIPEETLIKLGLSIADIAQKVKSSAQDTPAGTTHNGRLAVRTLGQADSVKKIETIPILTTAKGTILTLGQIATVKDTFEDDEQQLFINGQKAIELDVNRSLKANSLKTDKRATDLYQNIKNTAPKSLLVTRWGTTMTSLKKRIDILITNGLTGMVLVLIFLCIFMNFRSAFWVMMGIPTSLLGMISVFYLLGGTINMISLFAMVMALGIIVDDGIVVSEHTETLFRRGASPGLAATLGAKRMFWPVFASSITTVVAFVPVLSIPGPIGSISKDLALVMISVVSVSLIECFLILPAHMKHALEQHQKAQKNQGFFYRFRKGFDTQFNKFRDGPFQKAVTFCVQYRYATITVALALLLICFAMIMTGKVPFSFFPSPEGSRITASFRMTAGSTRSDVKATMDEVERAFDVGMKKAMTQYGIPDNLKEIRKKEGKPPAYNLIVGYVQYTTKGKVIAELVDSDNRLFTTKQFIALWQKEIRTSPKVDSLRIRSSRTRPGGEDFALRLMGNNIDNLKAASLAIQPILAKVSGVSQIEDNLSYGTPEVIFKVNKRGQSLGLSNRSLGTRLRNIIQGVRANRFVQNERDVDVLVHLPKTFINKTPLGDIYIQTPKGPFVPLSSVTTQIKQASLRKITREGSSRYIDIAADLDDKVVTPQQALTQLQAFGLQDVLDKYHLTYTMKGIYEEQQKDFSSIKLGVVVMLLTIYVILAWVFSSYTRPITVMLVLPFGAIGAIGGVIILGQQLSMLSIIAILGLMGIAINDSIILVSTIQERIASGEATLEACINGSSQRLRAVFLTSATTIVGLISLLFERSNQAQFLIPLATVIIFGLGFVTLLVLFLVPSFMCVQRDIGLLFRRKKKN